MSTRKAGGKGYVHEISDWEHEQLAFQCHSVNGHLVVSSYPSPLYDRLYSDWPHDDKMVTASGQQGTVPSWKDYGGSLFSIKPMRKKGA